MVSEDFRYSQPTACAAAPPTPQSSITRIGFHFFQRRTRNAATISTMPTMDTPPPYFTAATCTMLSAADAISATTTGRSAPSTFCIVCPERNRPYK